MVQLQAPTFLVGCSCQKDWSDTYRQGANAVEERQEDEYADTNG